MRAFLVFALYGPMAAFGGVAVGERRGGDARPSRSAVLGLLAASKGIERDAADRLAAIEHGYGVAVRIDAAGVALSDYHTAQVPPARRGVSHATRRAELDAPELETILSRREYRTDALFSIAIWARDAAPIPLDALQAGLRLPGFVLSIGRKSCPLGLPPGAEIVMAQDALAAIEHRAIPAPEQVLRQRLRAMPVLLACDPGGMSPDHTPHWTEMRRDAVASRARWQFGLRPEQVFYLPHGGTP